MGEVYELYQMLYDVHRIFFHNKLEYWMTGGTLLGAIRNGGIIKHDDDADLCIMSHNKHLFLSLAPALKKCGYSISQIWFGYKIFFSKYPKLKGFKYSFPFIDIMLIRKIEGKYRLSYKEAREVWPKEKWTNEDLFPLKLYRFGDFALFGPDKFKPYLNGTYGRDWNENIYITYDHRREEEIYPPIKRKLTIKDREPLSPLDVKERKCINTCLKRGKHSVDPLYWMKQATKTCSRGSCINDFGTTKMGIFVISCSRSNKRFDRFKKSAAKDGIKNCHVWCVKGRNFNSQFICDLKKKKLLSPKAEMTNIEIAINMSHYNCWQRVVNSCYDYGMIFEDDVILKKSFSKNIKKIIKQIPHFSILHLWNGNWANTPKKHVATIDSKITIVQEIEEYNAGGTGYIISRPFAQFLIRKFFPILYPQDVFIGENIDYGNHFSIKTKFNKKTGSYESPLIEIDYGGPGGTGELTTQEYLSPTVDTVNCKPCNNK